MKAINPQHYSYAFRLGKYDCFKVLTGKCSLELTEKEYAYYEPLTKSYNDGSVDYCRQLAAHLTENNLFKEDTGIYAYLNACGHVSFADGQHRTCIAKKIGITELTVTEFSKNEGICRVCYFKEQEKSTPIFKKLFNKIKTPPIEKFNHEEFIDDEPKEENYFDFRRKY